MSLLGSIQPGRLRSYLADALRDGPGDDGLIQRFQVLVWPDPPRSWKLVDAKPDSDTQERVVSVLRRIVELSDTPPMLFRFDPDGKNASRVTVKLGRASVNTIEVIEGLKVGDKVILSDMSAQDSHDHIRLN